MLYLKNSKLEYIRKLKQVAHPGSGSSSSRA
jgi:hypothetical protein